jgi:6,7-dimethyl-8-ribityllumazine synthase
MQGGSNSVTSGLDGRGLRIGIVRARFNETVTLALERACRTALHEMGVQPQDIHGVTVPGALEVPLALQGMAESGRFDALVALGCIIRGETYHFELVANESGAGVTRVGLDHHIPIANAILTVEDGEQARIRQEEKGRDAAVVAVEMTRLLASLAALAEPAESDEKGAAPGAAGSLQA